MVGQGLYMEPLNLRPGGYILVHTWEFVPLFSACVGWIVRVRLAVGQRLHKRRRCTSDVHIDGRTISQTLHVCRPIDPSNHPWPFLGSPDWQSHVSCLGMVLSRFEHVRADIHCAHMLPVAPSPAFLHKEARDRYATSVQKLTV